MSTQPMWVEGMQRGSKVGPTRFEISHSPVDLNRHLASRIHRSTRVDRVSQQHLTIVVHRLNEDLLLADGQVIEAVLSLAVPVLAMVFQIQARKRTHCKGKLMWSSDYETSRSDCETSQTDCATWIVKLAADCETCIVKLAVRIVKL